MPALIAGCASTVGEGFNRLAMFASMGAPGMQALPVPMLRSIEGAQYPPTTPPSQAIAARILRDRIHGLDCSLVGRTREG